MCFLAETTFARHADASRQVHDFSGEEPARRTTPSPTTPLRPTTLPFSLIRGSGQGWGGGALRGHASSALCALSAAGAGILITAL